MKILTIFGSPLGMRARYKYYGSYKSIEKAQATAYELKQSNKIESVKIDHIKSTGLYDVYASLKKDYAFSRERRGFQAP